MEKLKGISHSRLGKNVIIESRDIEFFENKFQTNSTNLDQVFIHVLQSNPTSELVSSNKRQLPESSSASKKVDRPSVTLES